MIATEIEEHEKVTLIKAAKKIRRRQDGRRGAPSSEEASRVATPLAQKYILRKAGTATAKDSAVSMTKEGSGRVSVESLKEKLGVSEQQIAGILKDAEKEGRVRKTADGSYVWVS